MKNLDKENILLDYGEIDLRQIKELAERLSIFLPTAYVTFITKHNGASLKMKDCFNYFDPNREGRKTSNSIAFVNFEKIEDKINRLKKADESFPGYGEAFKEGLVPFGDNGGGDLICFDYRNNRMTNDPPIVIWYHEVDFEHRVVFVANNFEEFIDMLHEPKD
jgi:hypothetical protein